MTRPSELGVVALLFVCTLLTAMFFAPRGINAGFVDMGHDGYTLREALDLEHGATLFKDTYEQYGMLGPFLNLGGFKLLGHRLLAIKYAIAIWYALIAVLLYRGARHFLDPWLSAASVLVWLSLAPFYQHGVMISVHVYVLFAQAAAALALLAYVEKPRAWLIVVAGFFCGVSCVLKQSVGFLFAVAVAFYFLTRLVRRQITVRTLLGDLTIFALPALTVIGSALLLLWVKGALHDWYLQTILFPRQFYLGTGGEDTYCKSSNSIWALPARFICAQMRENVAYYWYVMRAVLAAGAVFAVWKRRADFTSEKVVLVASLTLVLWAAAYPSAHFMHQWWTFSLGLAAFIYCVRVAVGWLLERYSEYASLARGATLAAIVLLVWPGLTDRIDAATRTTFDQQETLTEPWVISGMKTDPETRADLTALYSAIGNFRRHHPGTQLVSIDSSDGWVRGIAESLLWLSLVDGNTHRHPVYWSMPVLSTQTYPDYPEQLDNEIALTRPLLGEASVRPYEPRPADGYYLLLAIRTRRGYWYLYAPMHDESVAHHEVTKLIRISSGRKRRSPDPTEAGDIATVTADDPLGTADNADDVDDSEEMSFDPVDASYAVPARREDRAVYRWPGSFDVPDVLPRQLDAIDDALASHDDRLHIDKSVWTTDGRVRGSYTYLLESESLRRSKGDFFIARGQLDEGGFTLGLQRGDLWIGFVNVTTPGRFAVMLRVPSDGAYRVVLANCVNASWKTAIRHPMLLLKGLLFQNRFQVTSAGWTRSSASGPTSQTQDNPR